MVVPVGDPLATVQIWDADVDNDGDVDIIDRLTVQTSFGSCSSCPEDITRDGTVNQDDVDEVLAVEGRTHYTPIALTGTPVCAPAYGDGYLLGRNGGISRFLCLGDINDDLLVDASDQLILDDWSGCDFAIFDVDGDGVIGDTDDDAMVSNYRSLSEDADVDSDSDIDCIDIIVVYGNYCDGDCTSTNLLYDYNCDGKVDLADAFLPLSLAGYAETAILARDYNNSGAMDCSDLAELVANFWPVGGGSSYDAKYDVDGDGDVDCTDEGLYEAWMVVAEGVPGCPSDGCRTCP